jgi:hypothetical protein
VRGETDESRLQGDVATKKGVETLVEALKAKESVVCPLL